MKKTGIRPSSTKAIEAKCHSCMGYYMDGRKDCGIVKCPLYYWMPYRNSEPDLIWYKYSTRGKGLRPPTVSNKKNKKENT